VLSDVTLRSLARINAGQHPMRSRIVRDHEISAATNLVSSDAAFRCHGTRYSSVRKEDGNRERDLEEMSTSDHWHRQLWGTGARDPPLDFQLVILGITRFTDSDESCARFSVQ